jgi:dTMP kinase
MDGTFISFEGIEGSGKSTQARRLAERLGPLAVLTQEPGGTELGRAVRELLLHRREAMAPTAEALLYFADRAQHVASVVRPALAAGRVVITDRYVDSSLAYQGYGRGLSLELLRAVARLATDGLAPHFTIFLEVPVHVGLARVGRRGEHDRLEAEPAEFHERVRAGYAELIGQEPSRWISVNGEGSDDDVAARVLAAATSRGILQHGLR